MGISIFDPLILEKSNRLRLELSGQKGTAVCSKRNTSVAARFDSGQIQARAPESLSQIASLSRSWVDKRHHVFDFAGQDTRPNGCANGNDFIGIDRRV
jgi:hypothetical protein